MVDLSLLLRLERRFREKSDIVRSSADESGLEVGWVGKRVGMSDTEGRREGPLESVIVEAREWCVEGFEAAVLLLRERSAKTDVRFPLALISVRSIACRRSPCVL